MWSTFFETVLTFALILQSSFTFFTWNKTSNICNYLQHNLNVQLSYTHLSMSMSFFFLLYVDAFWDSFNQSPLLSLMNIKVDWFKLYNVFCFLYLFFFYHKWLIILIFLYVMKSKTMHVKFIQKFPPKST